MSNLKLSDPLEFTPLPGEVTLSVRNNAPSRIAFWDGTKPVVTITLGPPVDVVLADGTDFTEAARLMFDALRVHLREMINGSPASP